MKVQVSAAREMLVEMGWEAQQWSEGKMTKKLNNLPELMEDAKEPTSKSCLTLFRAISKAVQDGEGVEVVADGSAEKNGKKGKDKKGPKKANGKGSPNRDDFGTQIGSNNWKLNEQLSKKPQPIAELRKKAGLKGGGAVHLRRLVDRGLVKETKEGFAIK